jgi:DNA topoisomerase-1
MKNLVIVESPTKAKTLSSILGKEYTVKASLGHVRDLPQSSLGVDVENNFEPEYVVSEKAKKNVSEVVKEAKDADVIYLATDPDREGEAISWHLQYLIEHGVKKKKQFKRAVFHEITKSSIEAAFAHCTELNTNLVDAQQGRRVLDRLVGYKLSPLLWKKVRFGLSAGRVQSVAVRLVVDRERERIAFKQEEYFTIEGEFTNAEKETFKANLAEIDSKKLAISSQTDADNVCQLARSEKYKVSSLKVGERKRQAYPPFKTSTLQQAASNIFSYSARTTMSAAQKLFEKGLITYHRTDSLSLSGEFVSSARSFIQHKMGDSFLPEKPIFYKTKSKNAQEAHEAIRPTNLNISPVSAELKKMGDYERNIYKLIFIRSLECQMLPAVYETTSVELSSQRFLFRASGNRLKFSGWLEAGNIFGFKKEEDEEDSTSFSARLSEGDDVNIREIIPTQHFTQPPARYSDATLIKALEELEIGRPSTYAPTISTIISRGYVSKEGKYFVPEDVSYVVTDMLATHFPAIVDYAFTALVEEGLDKIAEGELQWRDVIRDFYIPFEKNVAEKEIQLKKTDMTKLGESDELCQECGKILFIKLGKYGKFLSCSGFPDCKYAKPIFKEGEVQEEFGLCELCDTGKLILKQGKFGKFIACSNYPKCKNAKPYLEKIGVICPKCQQGDVVVKKAKRRIFYGCSRYPDCDYASWKIPVAGEPYVEKKSRKPAKEGTVVKSKSSVVKKSAKTKPPKKVKK